MKKKVLVVGELNVDILLNNIHGFPVVGQEILADQMTLTLGSSSAIFAANLSTLGVTTSFCGMTGKDLFGRFVIDALEEKGINTSLIIESDKHQTGLTMILNYKQDRANITHCGAMDFFTLNDIPLSSLSQFSHLHLSSYFLQKGLQKDIVHLFKTAKEKGLSTSLDIQWDPAGKWNFPYADCLPYIDLFLPNEKELLALTGASQLQDALEKLAPFARTIVVKQGENGATAFCDGCYTHAAPYLHKKFVDAIGAGDSFNAGFISSYLEGKPLQQNLMFGNLAGATNTTAAGGTGAFTDRSSFVEAARTIFKVDI